MATQIKVNHEAWSGLPKDQQEAINEIISDSFGRVEIVPDKGTAAPQATARHAALSFPGGSGLCKLLCQIGATFGHAQCNRLKEPAKTICNTGVDTGEQFCESKCH